MRQRLASAIRRCGGILERPDYTMMAQRDKIGLEPFKLSRRRFVRYGAACLPGLTALFSGCASFLKPPTTPRPFAPLSCAPHDGAAFDYIVVGSGAGGGPLAANLALAGFRVLLLEAGGSDEPYNYRVPAFHAQASEDERLRWDFFVRHYADDQRQRRDDKFRPEQGGVLYPRSGTLGGCTAHNAMIFVYPQNSDWDYIAELTGDASWRSGNMRRYFERLERCEYVDPSETASRHGFRGWLTSTVADPSMVVHDKALGRLVRAALRESYYALGRPITRVIGRLRSRFDPNDWRLVEQSSEGICVIPITTYRGERAGNRDHIRRVQRACPNNLVVKTHALATRVILDADNRATGVEYFAGLHLYRADPRYREDALYSTHTVSARREVILAGGAFNTPQLLKLSGIGPRAELERFGIPVRLDLAGVGENLQDRYEVGVVSRFKRDFAILKDMIFHAPEGDEKPDPQFLAWLQGKGPYTTNGGVIALMKRSYPERREPDLFIFGMLGYFKGYFPGYSKAVIRDKNFFTWAILKGHINNTAGRVTLRSADPRDRPDINFHYFEEGTDHSGDDLESVVSGVETVRRINERCRSFIEEEAVPGGHFDTREKIRQFVKDNAWGHHASCTCKMGPADDPMAVVDSRFRVHGARGLRVVDASVFPKIPGFFIVSAVYMISEKASDVIIEEARENAAGSRASTAG
jgi:choline dehydrogenase